MDEYRSNANVLKDQEKKEEKKLEKVISGSARIQKQSEWRKLRDIFIAEDADTIKTMLLEDVIVPAIKKIVVDVISGGITAMFYGKMVKSGNQNTNAGKVSYTSYYTGGTKPAEAHETQFQFDNIVLDSKAEAEDVLTRMFECIEKYGAVTVNDLYDLVGIDGTHTDCKYGWKNLQSANVIRVHDGYLLKLPRVTALN